MQQATSLVAFTKGSTWSFHTEISLDHPHLPEIAHIWHDGPAKPMFFIVPLANNIVEIYDVLQDSYKTCTLDMALITITAAEKTSGSTRGVIR